MRPESSFSLPHEEGKEYWREPWVQNVMRVGMFTGIPQSEAVHGLTRRRAEFDNGTAGWPRRPIVGNSVLRMSVEGNCAMTEA
jgi:hypothetical protein